MRMRRAVFDAAVAQHRRRVFTLAEYLLGDRQEAAEMALGFGA
jgi:DNA-directed RNA polymerase specialized sigma24 family protein